MDKQPNPVLLDSLEPLVGALRTSGFHVVGPTVRDGVIRFAELSSAAELPIGWTDDHEPGRYRLSHESGELVFGYAASPDSAKRYTHPPRTTLFRWGTPPVGAEPDAPPTALIGLRACDLAALAVQDRVLGGSAAYRARRAALFLVTVDCATPSAVCFCTSMGTGPKTETGFDLALTELTDPHRFLARAGSEHGAAILAALPHRPAELGDLSAADDVTRTAVARMEPRRFNLDGVKEQVVAARTSPIWEEIAARCLTCANCTMVCPTCFCTTVEDGTSLSDGTAERVERWDSCFALGFTELGGEPVRASGAARYRQWLSHKFSTWVDQFGEYGCVGCGRCVTWCPAGIDLVEELERLR